MKKMLEKIDYSNPENKHRMNDLFINLLDSAREEDKGMYDYVYMEVYEIAHGKKIDEECGKNWVCSMLPEGEHWSIEETTNAMYKLGYNLDKVDYYVVSNMMYNDYYNLVKDDEELALKMAKDWLNDEDSVDNKLYEYWKYIVERD